MQRIAKPTRAVLLLLFPLSVGAQDAQWHTYIPIPRQCQERMGAAAASDGTIGASFIQRFMFHLSKEEQDTLTKTGEIPASAKQEKYSLSVARIVPGGPAEKAGLGVGSQLLERDGTNAVPLDECEFRERVRASPGRSIPLWMIPPAPAESIAAPITIEVKRLDQVEPHKARGFDSIYENALGGKAPMSLNLWLHRESGNFVLGFTVTNWTKVLLKVEEAKIFILDKNGQQLELLRFAEWKYGTEKLLLEANSLLSTKTATIPYQVPPAPPPPTRYTVSGTSRGTYTLTPMGTDTVYVSGQSYSEYQIEAGYGVGEQTAYLATSITTAINNILIAKRNREIRKKDEELDRELLNAIRSIKEDIAEGEKRHFDTTRFLAPDETRIGQFRFKSSGTNDLSSLRVIVALTNATTGKDEFTTFEFRP